MMIPAWTLVFLGGGAGALARYGMGQLIRSNSFPYATLSVNLLGSLIIGLLMASSMGSDERWRLLLMTGLLGGFTTFSSFSLETWQLFERGAYGPAFVYALGSLILGLVMVAVGLVLGRAILGQ